MIFDDKKRDFKGPKSHVESDFSYLDRSARSEARRVRAFLNELLVDYPESDRNELATRLVQSDSTAFDSAFFELFLFGVLRALGCDVAVHPELNNDTGARPDFLVRTQSGDEFYLEAVLASDFSAAEKSAQKRKDVVLQALEDMESPNFFLGITAEGDPTTPPSSRRLKGEVERWLSTLDPDRVAADLEHDGFESLPSYEWKHEDWMIRFDAWPRSSENRHAGKRTIGTLSGGVRFVNTWEPIREAVRTKGNRYGDLDKPLLVAINVNSMVTDRIDEMQGLFGQEEYLIDRDDPSGPPQMRRKPNGAWYSIGGPQYTRVSGAWIFAGLNPWNIVSRKHTIYLNPWASRELPPIVQTLNHAKAVEQKMIWAEGRSIASLFGLSKDWPS